MRDRLEVVSREMTKARSRREAFKIFGAGLLGASAVGAMAGTASAAPRTCLTCACGVGRPCNVKSQVCTEQRAFPNPAAACTAVCEQGGFKFCGGVVQTHCPRGCP